MTASTAYPTRSPGRYVATVLTVGPSGPRADNARIIPWWRAKAAEYGRE